MERLELIGWTIALSKMRHLQTENLVISDVIVLPKIKAVYMLNLQTVAIVLVSFP